MNFKQASEKKQSEGQKQQRGLLVLIPKPAGKIPKYSATAVQVPFCKALQPFLCLCEDGRISYNIVTLNYSFTKSFSFLVYPVQGHKSIKTAQIKLINLWLSFN